MSTYADNDPGQQPLETHVVGEEWGHADDKHTAIVMADHVTAEGRLLRQGDIITPRQARAERLRGLQWRAL